MDNILAGLELLLSVGPLMWLVGGVAAGFLVGVLPGFSGSNAAALVLPFSIALPLEEALLLVVGIYAGASFAGAVPAILMNVPGTAGAAATALDGYPMAQKGKAELAIGVARMASVLGGVIGMLIILTVIGPLSDLALSFGAREMFVVALFGLTVIASVVGDSVRKGLLSAFLGLLIAAMSASALTAQPRFTMGFVELYEDIPFIPAVIGLFAFTQMFFLVMRDRLVDADAMVDDVGGSGAASGLRRSAREVVDGIKLTLSHPVAVLRSSVIGSVIGVIPGTGTTVANFISYGEAQRRSKTPDEFGKGAPEGIIASEACDNAVTGATLVPTLTLGIPGSATAAVMLAALYLHGVQPGPRVMVSHAPEAYAVLVGMLVASLLILPLGILLATPMTYITRLTPRVLVPTVLLLCVVGAFAVRNSIFDVGLAVVFGVLGLVMRLNGYPIVPLVLGLILGPLAESNFMRALLLGGDDPRYFFGSTTAQVMWALLLVTVVMAVRKARRQKRSAATTGPGNDGTGAVGDEQRAVSSNPSSSDPEGR
jgi:putative tricarboxylic transport membrane protein